MSGVEQSIDAGPSKRAVNGSFQKKREFYGKGHHHHVAVRPEAMAGPPSSSSSSSPPTPLPPPPQPPPPPPPPVLSPSPRRPVEPVPSNSSNRRLGYIYHPPLSSLGHLKPDSVTFVEHLYLESTVLKNNLLLLQQALTKGIDVRDLFVLREDIHRAKDELDRGVCATLGDVQRELERRLQQRQSRRPPPSSPFVPPPPLPPPSLGPVPNQQPFPFTPTALHPFPPLYWPAPPPPLTTLPVFSTSSSTTSSSSSSAATVVAAAADSSAHFVPVPPLSAQPAH